MVGITREDRDSLRFLWVKDLNTEPVEFEKLRFTRVVFGVTSSPFLLNITIDTHIRKLQEMEPVFVDKFLRSMYVDDLTVSLSNVDSAYEFYEKSKQGLSEAGFKLRKFMTNSRQLHERLSIEDIGDMGRDHKVLGVLWNPGRDVLIFDMRSIIEETEKTMPTKRGIVGIATRFFDPLGMLSPNIICFKILFQILCEAKISWDGELPEELFVHWTRLLKSLREFKPIEIPCSQGNGANILSCSLHGFCNASLKAYAAIIYLVVRTEVGHLTKLLCSKTRVAPIKSITIHQLELLSALLLSRLVNTVTLALSSELMLRKLFITQTRR
uniref:Reverse transcriptase domain-containing protein n=1 Tax=Amphimedon queenslandica TaxID=400682 RepID=A0A1X7UBY6_AMPQE